MKYLFNAISGLCALLLAGNIASAEHSPDLAQVIMQKAYNQSRQHPDQVSEVVMTIIDSKGREKTRYFEFKYKILADRSKALIRFFQPASIKNTGLLSEVMDSSVSVDTKQWIYLPAARSIRSLTSSEKHQSFMGSDLTNSDMAGRKPTQDVHRVLEETPTYVLIESKPKNQNDLYSKLVTKIHLKYFVPLEISFFDRDGKLLKVLENRKFGHTNGMYFPKDTIVENRQSGGTTILKRRSFSVTKAVGENEVGLRGLKVR